MNQIKCELCGSTELVKQDGLFVCQHCGCKYSPEDAKKLMIEVTKPVQVVGISSADQKNENAKTLIKLGEYKRAREVFEEITNQYPSDYRGWLGLVETSEPYINVGNYITRSKNHLNQDFIPSYELDRNDGIISAIGFGDFLKDNEYFSKAISVATVQQKKSIEEIYEKYVEKLSAAINRTQDGIYKIQHNLVELNNYGTQSGCPHGGCGLTGSFGLKIIRGNLFYYSNFKAAFNIAQVKSIGPDGKLVFDRCIRVFLDSSKKVRFRYEDSLQRHNYCAKIVGINGAEMLFMGYTGDSDSKYSFIEYNSAFEDSAPPLPITLSIADEDKMVKFATGQKTIHKRDTGEGCYVATAVYGSYDCPEVWTLRRYRDFTLAKTWYGRAFIRTYYAVSPTIVRWFGDTLWFKAIWRRKLDRIVTKLKKHGYANTPYK